MHKLGNIVEEAERNMSISIENMNLALSIVRKAADEIPQKAKEAGFSLTNKTRIRLFPTAADVFDNGAIRGFDMPFPVFELMNRGEKYFYAAGYDINPENGEIFLYFARRWQEYEDRYSWENGEWLPVGIPEETGSMGRELEKKSSFGTMFLVAYHYLNRKKYNTTAEFVKMCENEAKKYLPLAVLLDLYPAKLRCTVVDDKIAVTFCREGIGEGYAVGYEDGKYILYQNFHFVLDDEGEQEITHEVARTSNLETIKTFIKRTIEKSNTYRPDTLEAILAIPLSLEKFVVIEGPEGFVRFNPVNFENLTGSEMNAARFIKDWVDSWADNYVEWEEDIADDQDYDSSETLAKGSKNGVIVDMPSSSKIITETETSKTGPAGVKAEIIDFRPSHKRLDGQRH